MSLSQTDGQIGVKPSYGFLTVEDRRPAGSVGGPVPLVFLQGLLAGPQVWNAVCDSLAAGRRRLTVDWPFGAHTSPMALDCPGDSPA